MGRVGGESGCPPCCHFDSRATASRIFEVLIAKMESLTFPLPEKDQFAVGHLSVLRVLWAGLPLATRWPKDMDPPPVVVSEEECWGSMVHNGSVPRLCDGFGGVVSYTVVFYSTLMMPSFARDLLAKSTKILIERRYSCAAAAE